MKNRIPRFCYLLCLFFPILLAGQNSASSEQNLIILNKLRQTQPLLNKAFDLLAAKDWEGATRQFNRCLEVVPENPNACFGLATIAKQKGEFSQALTWIEQAEKGCLYFSQVWENQNMNAFHSSQEEKDRLTQIAYELYTMGMDKVKCRTDEYIRESNEISKKAKDISSKENTDSSPFAIPADFFALHGDLLFKLKRFKEAEAHYLKALALSPNHERALNNLINIYFISHQIEQAQSWLEKATQQNVKINPGLVQAVRQAKLDQKPEKTP